MPTRLNLPAHAQVQVSLGAFFFYFSCGQRPVHVSVRVKTYNADLMRIVIATVTAGGGHLAAAAALEDAWRQTRPTDIVDRIDTLKFASPLNRRLHTDGYVQIAERTPTLWGTLYDKTDSPKVATVLARLRRLFPSSSRVKFSRYLNRVNPDAVLCTHYMPLWTLSAWKHAVNTLGMPNPNTGRVLARRPVLVVTVVTDFVAHALWIDPCVDLYCVATAETKAQLVARAVCEQDVAVTGIPISPKFAQNINMRTARRLLGLRNDVPVILVLSGGFGMGPVADTVLALDKVTKPFQMLVVCGRNEKLRSKLAVRTFAHPTRVLGFVSNMHVLMAAANLVVTKAGGLTVSEALAMGKPLVIVNPIPGQEVANADFLLEHGAGIKATRPEILVHKVSELLGSAKLTAMAKAARKLAHPTAAINICNEVLARLNHK